jgi:osmotically-inducible protein OsmY
MKRCLLLLTAGLAVLAATDTRATKAAAPSHQRTGGPAAPLSDAELEKAIRARFARSKLAAEKLQVHAQGGVVTIEGRTDVIQRKGAATRMARTAGARDVINKIELSDAAREKAEANLAKGRRRAQVKRSDSAARSEPR